MKTIYSIVYKSNGISPEKYAQYMLMTEKPDDAINAGMIHCIEQLGNFGWQPYMVGKLEIKDFTPGRELDKNFLMKTIIDNKDGILFGAAAQYLTKAEVEFINSKFNDENKIKE